MSSDENHPPPHEPLRKRVFALCNYPALLTSGILWLEELQDIAVKDYPADVRREHRVFMELVDSYPSLLDHLTNGEEEDIVLMGELLGKGVSGTLKSAVFEWLVPRGQVVIPPLSQNIISDRGFNHAVTGALLCPAGLNWSNAETKQSLKSGELAVHGDQWPMFLYAGSIYDPEDPWKGLLRMDREPKATRSSNAYLHGMKSVTKGSLAYIAMQVWLSSSSSSVFSHTDTVMDSNNSYHSILDLLEDPDENEEVADLMMWWTHWVFPNSSSLQCSISKNSALSKIQEKRAILQERATASATLFYFIL
ncbi:hypothetical protein EV702DRAFT_1182816 [Suillus placidus]|uniref:Uncharacterized protein n=1 Tax=Suillus placidus TaxID=48579 RepID=A0A9P6ZF79_9AGAM|nr:hypothetical protein EV702DRAFT_1182816 [Suillus placidus]